MPTLWLAQYLCPQRHALCALAYDLEHTSREEAEQSVKAVLEVGRMNPWCGICGSRDLHVEHGKLFTDDWTVATALLRETERRNLITRMILGEPRRN